MAQEYFTQPTDADVENFLKDQHQVRGSEFDVPTLAESVEEKVTKPATSMFSMYREALGAAQRISLSTGEIVTVGKPKVKSIKYLLSNIDAIQKKAKNAESGANPLEALEEFEKIMLDCLIFEDNDAARDRREWFDDLPADDGLLIAETFTQVFDIKYLLARSAGEAGKK